MDDAGMSTESDLADPSGGCVRWAVVGTSRFALDWAAGGIRRASAAALVALVGRDRQRTEAAAAEVGAARVAASIEQLDRADVDAVHLVVPNPQHLPLAVAAAEHGLHVLVEKPMAPTVAECDRMRDAARANGVRLFVAHCMSWTSPLAGARDAIAAGAIGRPVIATVSLGFDARPSGEWRQALRTEDGGGPLYDLGAHAIHALTWLFGPVASVSGLLRRVVHDYPAEDLAVATLTFASGVVGQVQASFASHHNALVIHGQDGMLVSEEWLGRDMSGRLRRQAGWWLDGEALPLERRNVFELQADDVSRAILHGRPSTHAEPERGAEVVAIIAAAIRSARDGGQRVELPAPSALPR